LRQMWYTNFEVRIDKILSKAIAIFAFIVMAGSVSLAATYFGNAGCYQGTSTVFDSDTTTSLEVGDALQYIYSPDATKDPPSASGGVTGDDQLWLLTGVGTDTVYGGFFPSPSAGNFYHTVTGEVSSTPQVYVRAWNNAAPGISGSYYGDSGFFTLTTPPDAPSESSLATYSTTNEFDAGPPLPPTLEATPEADGDIFLTWQNTNEADFAGTIIRFFAGGSVYPTNETEGTLFINSTGGTGETRSSTHESLTWNTTYKYSAFSYDSNDNYSSAATADATSTDTLPPTVEVFTPDGGEVYAGGSVHNITWEATENGNSGFGSTPITIRFSSDEGNSWIFITQEANDGSYSWTLPLITSDECRVSVEATDNASNVGTDMSAANFEINSSSPEVSGITVSDRVTGDTVRTNDRTISVEASGVTGSPTLMRIAQDAGFTTNSTGWIAYQNPTTYETTAGDGTKNIYYQLRNSVSNESDVVSNSIILDTTGPTGISITINNGDPYTNEVNVELTLAATDEWAPIMMIISNEATFAGSAWEPYSTSKAWTITTGDGTKEVYAKFRDAGSNESGNVSDDILYDATPPTVEVTAPDGGEIWAGGSVHNITWTATDEGSGFGATPIVIWFTSNEGSSWEYITTEANSGSYSWTLPTITSDKCIVSVEAVDRATNVGTDMSADNFTIDSASPEVSSISLYDRITGDSDRTNDQTITVEAFGVSADATQMMIAQDAGFSVNSTGWISFTATTEYSLTAGDGTKEVYYKVRDAVSSESAPVSNSIILDTTGPTGISITINNGDPYTNEVNVELTLAATDEWVPMMMLISNEASFAGANWETFSTTKAWVLPSGDGTKTVYAKFRDAGSNESGSTNDDILLDTIAPTVEVVSPDGGEVWIGGSNHNITWNANDSGSGFGAAPIVIWYTSNDGASWNYITTEANTGSYSWTLPTIDSTQCRVSVEATDRALNTGRDMSAATFTIDSTAPTVTSIEVRDRTSGDPLRTNEQPVSVEAFGVSADATQMRLAEDAGFTINDTGWISYAANYEYILNAGDGSKTVYFEVRDAALQESNTVSDTIILDTAGPTGTSVSINSGAYATNETSVQLTLAATDPWMPMMMIISNEATFAGSAWEPYSTSKSWTLYGSDGTKTVYAKFRDAGSNESGNVSDDIIYDTTPPTVEVTDPDGGEIWAGASVHNITWTAADSGSGIASGTPITIRFSSDEGSSWIFITQEANSGSYSWTLPTITSDECRVSVEAVDRATNIGTDMSAANFEIDSTAPYLTSIEARDRITGNPVRTNDRTISVEAFGVGGGQTEMRIAQDNGFTVNSTGWITYQNPTTYEVTTGDGTKTVYYQLRDVVLHTSNIVSDEVILDTTGPTGTSVSINSGAYATNETSVQLTLAATDVWTPIMMIVSNEATFAGSAWEPYSTSKAWTITTGDETKNVYANFRDAGSNESGNVSDDIIYDTTPPTVEVTAPDGGEIWDGGSIHEITWTAIDSGSGIGLVAPITISFSSNEGNSWEFITQEANDGSYYWTFPTISSNECRISVEAVDRAANVGADMSAGNFTIDSADPVVTSIEARDRSTGYPIRTNERTISVEAFGTSGDAVLMMIAQDAGFTINSTGWITIENPTTYETTAGDGTKNIYYKVMDVASNESNWVTDSIILDTTGPTGTSVSINSGAYATNETSVQLTLAATDPWMPMMMIISNEATFAGSAWEPYSTSKSWTLYGSDGTKTVYAKFRDAGSNESGNVSDDIIYDTTPPTVEVTDPDGGEIWAGASVHNITWTAADSGSGIASGTPITIRFSSDEGSSWIFITQEANSGSYSWTLPTITSDECRVSVEAVDRATNIGTDMSAANFEIDSTAPYLTSIEARDRITGNPVRTNDRTISVEAFGVGGGQTEMRIAQDNGFTVNSTGWITYQNPTTYEVTTGDGTKTVYYQLRDVVLHTSNIVSDEVILDTTGPTGTSVSINSGAYATNETSVTLTLAATDAWTPIMMIVSNEATFAGSAWESYSTSKAWTITAGDGTKNVYANFRDAGSNESGNVSDDIIYDTINPTVEVTAPDGGEIWAGGSVHNITWTAIDSGSGIASGTPITIRYSSDEGSSWNFVTQEANSGSYSWILPIITSDECRVSVEAVDRATNVGTDMSAANFEIDAVSPEVGSITVKDQVTGNTVRTNDRTVSVEASGVTGNPTLMRIAEDAGFTTNPTGWITYQNSITYETTAGDGTKNVYYQLRDGASKESSVVNNSIILDTTGPTGISLVINNGAAETSEGSVLLTLAATDEWSPLEMMISNEATFAGVTWEAFADLKNWTLSSGDGTKTVYAKFRDGGQNESTTTSDTIGLDSVPPSVEAYSPIGANVSRSTTILVDFSKDMNQSSAQSAFLLTPNAAGSFSWTANDIMVFTPDNPLASGVTYEVEISSEATDLIGNHLSPAPHIWQFRTVADDLPPVISEYKINGGVPLSGDQISSTPRITANIQDEGEASGISAIEILDQDNNKLYSGTYQDWGDATFEVGGVNDGDFEYTLQPLNTGTYDIKIWASDFSGNISEEVYTGLEVQEGALIIGPVLNYPNPFNPRAEDTKISFHLSQDTLINVYIYDITGSLKSKIICQSGEISSTDGANVIGAGGRAGYNEVSFSGRSAYGEFLPNGMYIVRIVSGTKVLGTGKMTILHQGAY
jgi:Bacterial Ig-like domain